ncbi:MAG: Lrp/AsnC family transcriptional regulator [Theionarchaea archaeon]|nr:Lrp/AsnC family transcriptional regulator [Theionarchaea archaeon]
MDELERNILNILQENSRLSFRKIAEKIGTTAATVSSRVEDLEKKGIIKKYTVLLDYDQLNKITLLLTIDTDLSVIDDVVARLSELKEVCCVLRVTGDFDLVVLVRCDSRRDAGLLLHTIHDIEGVRDIASQVVLETIKETLCVEV